MNSKRLLIIGASVVAAGYTVKKTYDKNPEFKKFVDNKGKKAKKLAAVGIYKAKKIMENSDGLKKASVFLKDMAKKLQKNIDEEVRLIEHKIEDDKNVVELV